MSTVETRWDRLLEEFGAICDTGGRQAGTESERTATALLRSLGEAATGVSARVERVGYRGWRPLAATLIGPSGEPLPLVPLLRSASTQAEGLDAEVIDLGRGSPEEFEAHRNEISGRIVLVRHELMFAPATIHRRRKLKAAIDAGAVGFLIAGPVGMAPVAGSAARDGERSIPAAGVSPETARALKRRSIGRPRVRLRIETEEADQTADNLFFDIAGKTDGRIVLSAHIDGHDQGESAIDNASGLAVALDAARAIAKDVPNAERGLMLVLFNVEEWALTGSARFVAGLSQTERLQIALNVNLDSVAGGSLLTALTSGFRELEPFLLRCAETAGRDLGLYRPLQMNSDHGNFACAGIPAFRLVAGFGDPTANTRLVLTPHDVRANVRREELTNAAVLTESILRTALDAPSQEVRRWRETD